MYHQSYLRNPLKDDPLTFKKQNQTRDVTPGDGAVQGPECDSLIILVGPFQISRFCDSVILINS